MSNNLTADPGITIEKIQETEESMNFLKKVKLAMDKLNGLQNKEVNLGNISEAEKKLNRLQEIFYDLAANPEFKNEIKKFDLAEAPQFFIKILEAYDLQAEIIQELYNLISAFRARFGANIPALFDALPIIGVKKLRTGAASKWR